MTQNNVKIAITGGIGSGKSTVSQIIADEGYAVFSCDEIYAELLSSGAFTEQIVKRFGDILLPDGLLDRKKLSAIVFGNGEALKALNEITHPLIMKTVLEKMQVCRISFCEVPLLFENGFESCFNGVIVVLRDKEKRISSVTQRDGLSAESVQNRINCQFNYDKYDFAEYYVLHNDENLNDLRQKTQQILIEIKKKCF